MSIDPMQNPKVREELRKAMLKPLNEKSKVKKVVGIISGKGGVGKSLVTALSAVKASRKGYRTGVLDADITGPSVPKMFGVHEHAAVEAENIIPAETPTGIKLISLNLLTDEETDPVVWRGPIIAGVVTQFWTDVVWGDIDIMFIDMPPGTGDVPLTVFQTIPLDGVIVVTSPQELVSMIVEKAIKMAGMMDVPVLGLVENMSYVKCPNCGEKIDVFGKSMATQVAAASGISLIDKIPMDPEFSNLSDEGLIEYIQSDAMDCIVDICEKLGLDKE